MRAFDGMRQARKADRPESRVAAVEFLDAALGADRRQLIKQYVENVDTGPRVLPNASGRRCRKCAQGFIFAYQAALEEALAQADNPRWKPVVPAAVLAAHRITTAPTPSCACSATSAGSRRSGWSCTKLYMRATELGVERVPVALGSVRHERDALDASSRNTCSCC